MTTDPTRLGEHERAQVPAAPAPGSDGDSAPEKARRQKKLRWWQKLLAMGFSLVILLAVELLLRLFNYGPNVDFVVKRLDRGDTQIMGINPAAYKRYYFNLRRFGTKDKQFAPWREFVQPKARNGFRVFFLGGSTVQGFPHTPNGAAPAFLEFMLQDVWRDRSVEVINCGVTAINSFSLRDWVVEVLDYQPDLLVVDAGHNEFYGACGPGSAGPLGASRRAVRFNLALREFRLVQAIEDLVNWVRSPPSNGGAGGLMEILAKDRLVRLGDPTYTECRDNFRANLEDIARSAREAGVPLVLCGLVSNERDLVPMLSLHREGLPASQLDAWQAQFDAGLVQRRGSDHRNALQMFEAAAEIDDTHAELIYRMAQCRDRLGEYDEALRLYRRARDLDGLRFRATTEFTDIIREVAANEGATYVDVAAAFEADSPNRLIGWNLMTDHLHPTIEGYHLLARTICTALGEQKGPWPAVDRSALPGFDEAAERLGIDDTSEMFSKIMVFMLSGRFPYADTPNEVLHQRLGRELARWQSSLEGPEAAAIAYWLKGKGESGETPHYHIAKAYLAEGNAAEALRYFRAAVLASEPHSLPAARARLGLAQARWAAAQADARGAEGARSAAEEALAYVRECLLIHPQAQGGFSEIEAELEALLGEMR